MDQAAPVRPGTRLRSLAAACAIAATAGLALMPAVAAATEPARPAPPPAALSKAGTPLFAAKLLEDVRARATPDGKAKSLRYLHELTEFNGNRTTIPILQRKLVNDVEWLRVILPERPNNQTGWIPASTARIVRNTWRIRVDLGLRILDVFHDDRRVARHRVVIGANSTPTPVGRFYVMEKVVLGTRWSPRGWALALSAFSNVLRYYDGGDGQVAIHARGSLTGALGSASSHGCVRVDDGVAAWLAKRIPDGSFVEIAK